MNAIVRLVEAPAWPILLWCGLAASLGAALVLPPPEPASDGRRRPRWPLIIAAGVGVFAPLYGLGFEAIARADFVLGASLGFAHGLFALALRLRSRGSHRPGSLVRTLAGWIVYGLIVGFLYPVPPA